MPDEMLTPGAPLWWVQRLEAKLVERRKECDRWEAYYSGNHPLPVLKGATDRHVDAYQRLLRKARSNWTGLIVDTPVPRLRIDGFRIGDDQAGDKEANSIWQANNLDADSEMAHTEAGIDGESYGIVWVNPATERYPLVTVEHASQVIVAHEAGTRRRLAALKVWCDEWTGADHATLYLPNAIHKFAATRPSTYVMTSGAPMSGPMPPAVSWADDVSLARIGGSLYLPSGVQSPSRWAPREVTGEPWPIPNPLGVVPVVPLRNRPRLMSGGRSDLDGGMTDIQDRINTTLFGRLMATEFAAFPQKWATGLDVPVDPVTGEPVEPFHVAVDRLLWSSDEGTKFGQFEESNLEAYNSSVEADIQHLAAISFTPPLYVLAKLVNISGDALKAAQIGLVDKTRRKMRHFGEAWEEILRLAFAVRGDDRSNVVNSEVIWADPEVRTEGELVDSIVKMRAIGLPLRMCFERYGMSSAEADRAMAMRAEEGLFTALEDLEAEPVGAVA